MTLHGVHFNTSSPRQLDELWKVPLECATILHLHKGLMQPLVEHFPGIQFMIRAYLSNWIDHRPDAWAREIASWWGEVARYNPRLTWANEMNLAAEGHPGGASNELTYPDPGVYRDIAAWNLTCVHELRRLLPGVRLYYPAESQGHSDDHNDAGYVGFEIERAAVRECDGICVHTAWNGMQDLESVWFGRRYRLIHDLFPDKVLWAKEIGSDNMFARDDGEQLAFWRNGLDSLVEAETLYLWDGDANNIGRIAADGKHPNIIRTLQAWRPIAIPKPYGGQTNVAQTDETASGAALGVAGAVIGLSVNEFARRTAIEIATDLVKGFEGFVSTPTPDVGGGRVIGYGHTIQSGEIFDFITLEGARGLLASDLSHYIKYIDQGVKVDLNEHQLAALISFVYNVGGGAFLGSELLIKLNRGDYAGAADELLRWDHAGGKVLPGLTRRRQLEREEFLKT